MDWNHAIHRNREALQRIVAALFVLAGSVQGKLAIKLPRYIYHAILRVLRPAEAAVRRLIIIAARDITLKARAPRLAPVGLSPNPLRERTPAFQLLDPLKRFAPMMDTTELDIDWTGENSDDFEEDLIAINAFPRISVPGLFDPVWVPPASAPSKFDLINAAHIARRLKAVSAALKSLPKEAHRFARWQAKRDVALAAKTKLHRLSPTRPGRPPGLVVKPTHEIHQTLRECHGLVMDLRAACDTS